MLSISTFSFIFRHHACTKFFIDFVCKFYFHKFYFLCLHIFILYNMNNYLTFQNMRWRSENKFLFVHTIVKFCKCNCFSTQLCKGRQRDSFCFHLFFLCEYNAVVNLIWIVSGFIQAHCVSISRKISLALLLRKINCYWSFSFFFISLFFYEFGHYALLIHRNSLAFQHTRIHIHALTHMHTHAHYT